MRNKISGVYCIECLINNKKYIGQTQDIIKRFGIHKSQLKYKKHKNKHLQSGWNKYKEINFKFYILEDGIIDESDRLNREQYFADLYKTYDNNYGYNVGKILKNPRLGIKCSEYRRKKIREIAKKSSNPTPEIIYMLKTMNIGRKHTREAIENMKIGQTGKKLSKKTKKKISIGQKLTQKNRTISEKRKIFAHTMKIFYFISPEGIIYKIIGLRPFCKEFNLDRAALMRVHKENSRNKTHKGWKKYNGLDNYNIIKDYTK